MNRKNNIVLKTAPDFLSHGELFCPGCFHKVRTGGVLLLVRNRGRDRWCLAHSAHVAMVSESCAVLQNAGEYVLPAIESSGNVRLRKVNEETARGQ